VRTLGEFSYDPETGHILHVPTGSRADIPNTNGYRRVFVDGKLKGAHRVAWRLHYGVWPGTIDHINRQRDDNRIENLRDVPPSVNTANASPRPNKTGYPGVVKVVRGGRFGAAIRVNGERRFLGTFETAELASKAYAKAHVDAFGFPP
jgi:hypothetical protein